MEKYLKALANIPHDKALHFIYGSVLFALVVHIVGAGIGLLVVTAVAALKEFYDYMHRNIHTPDVWDFVATVVGALVSASVLI